MKFFRKFFLSCFFSLACCISVFASTATASDAIYDEVVEEAEDEDIEEDIFPDIDYEQFFFDLYTSLVDESDIDSSAEEESDDEAIMEDVAPAMFDMPMLLSDSSTPDLPDVNCVWYHVLISGNEYDLYFPTEYADFLWISDSGYLYNVGLKTAIGRIFDGDVIPDSYAYPLVHMQPIMSEGGMSAIEKYGSYNTINFYYWLNGRKYYTQSFPHIQVLDTARLYHTSEFSNYVFYFLLTGGVLFLWLRSYKRY